MVQPHIVPAAGMLRIVFFLVEQVVGADRALGCFPELRPEPRAKPIRLWRSPRGPAVHTGGQGPADLGERLLLVVQWRNLCGVPRSNRAPKSEDLGNPTNEDRRCVRDAPCTNTQQCRVQSQRAFRNCTASADDSNASNPHC